MNRKSIFGRVWRGLSVLGSMFNAGRLFSGVLDMLDLVDA